jgi:hypothetical protein
MASVANKITQKNFHPVYKNSSLVPFSSRKQKCISIIITKYTSALCSRVVSGVTSNSIITFYLQQIYNKNFDPPPPLGDGGVRIYFLVKKRGGRGRKKSGLNTTQPFPYYRLVPHTIYYSQQKIAATKNVVFPHYCCLSHLLYHM